MFGKRLRELRINRNLEQKDIAKELGVLDATVSMWETGKRVPYYELLIKIAKYFNVSIDYLLGNEKKISKEETEIKEKQILKKMLINIGYMKESEDLSNEELENLIQFVKQNKNFIKNYK